MKMAKATIDVEANITDDAKWILNRQERMKAQRLEFIGDLFKYVTNLVLTYDMDGETISEIDDVDEIEATPARYGRWIRQDPTEAWDYRCSECGVHVDYKENYCPNCGAKMDEVEE